MQKSNNNGFTLDQCDLLKVIMMLMVIAYHSICLWGGTNWQFVPSYESGVLEYLCGWFNAFHVKAFTVASGYLFYYLRYEKGKYREFKLDITRRANRLLVPYAIVSLVWVIPFYFVFSKGTIIGTIRKYVLAVSPSQLWFLWMLFLVFVFFYIASDKILQMRPIFASLLFYLLYLVAIVGTRILPNVFQVWTAIQYLLYFYLGFLVRQGNLDRVFKRKWWQWLIVFTGAYSLGFYAMKFVTSRLLRGTLLLANPFISVLGVFFALSLAKTLGSAKVTQSKVFKLLKECSFSMYLFHQQFIYISNVFFDGKIPAITHAFVNFSFAMVASCILSLGLQKNRFTKYIFR